MRGKRMMIVAVALAALAAQAERTGPWPKEKAWAWHDAQPWYRGCNYMPASAANRVDQWQSYGSEARFAEVEREFALAQEVGFNAMRLLVEWQGFAVWLQEPDAFRANFERYLALMEKHGLKAFVVLGNDCSRPKSMWTMPKLGEQAYDVGYHGGRRKTQHGGFSEPGYLIADEPEYRAKFFAFCRELVTKYAHDGRVVMWELWNEPGAGNRGMRSAPLIKDLFALCWTIDPDQPLTANVWSQSTGRILNGGEPSEIERLAADLSDVVSYHGYHSLADQVKLADALAKRWGRPLYNTEWLLRIEGCEFSDNYAFMARRKIGALNWGLVNGKYQTHEPYEPCWRSKLEYGGRGDPTRWMHDLFRISHHPYDPREIAVARNVNAWADLDRRGESLRAKIAKRHRIVREDMWYGHCRTAFEFNGHEAWVVEPDCPPAEGRPWTWTMQWAEHFVDRTGVLELLKRGWHHVTIDLFDTRMNEKGLADAAAYQEFLVKELGLAPQANLVGMSWGGFFSTRYAANHPGNVRRIYLDAPLMNFDGFGGDVMKTPTAAAAKIGPWAADGPKDGGWSADPRMPVNLAAPIAKAGIPILLLYGAQDQTVIPALNCERFVKAFKAAGGSVTVVKRDLFGHHPHGLDPDKTQPVIDFFRDDLATYVDPFVGTSGTGHAFPGPCRPFGLVQPSPETGNASWRCCSGYCHDDAKILCFAQTHLNGTGQASLGDIAVMPVVADATKRNERASLGYYGVDFADGVSVEIAAGTRVARYRFTFPKGRPARIRFDFAHGLYRDAHHAAYLAKTCAVERVSNRVLRSFHHSDVWAPRDIASVCRFDRDFVSFADGVATFADGGRIELEIALSARSVAGAERNLAAEGGVPFERMVDETRAAWREILARMPPAPDADRTSFATAVYRLCIQPNVISDVGEPVRYSTFSLWDTFRSAHPMYERLVPERVPDFVNSLLDHFDRYGFLPRWELWGRETNCMIGDHAVQVIVDAWQHGFKGFDVERAYRAVRETLTTNRREGNPGYYPPREERDLWEKYGYFPCDLVTRESVSRTLESAHDDYRAYEFAKGLGKAEDAAFFERRSWNFTNLFDRATLCFRPKDSRGRFLAPFSPAASSPHYVEGSPLQYSWYAPHRTDWLIAAMGGKAAFEARLDAFFAGTLCPGETRGHGRDVTGLIGDYAHGNEPCHHVVDLYRLIGRGDKADALVRRICREFYRPTPDGLCGNDDCGQMSAWYLLRTSGL